jgi:hypothetical protein
MIISHVKAKDCDYEEDNIEIIHTLTFYIFISSFMQKRIYCLCNSVPVSRADNLNKELKIYFLPYDVDNYDCEKYGDRKVEKVYLSIIYLFIIEFEKNYILNCPPVLELQLMRWKQSGRRLAKNNTYFEFEEIIDLTEYLKKYGQEIEKSNIERKKVKKRVELNKFGNELSYTNSSFKFFPPITITKKPIISPSSSFSFLSSSSSLSKNISERLSKRYSFFSSSNNDIRKSKIIYKLHSIIIHSGGTEYGHYYVFVRKSNYISEKGKESEWYLLNDSWSGVVKWNEVKKDSFGTKERNSSGSCDGRSAYVLKYIRVDWEDAILGEYDNMGKKIRI